MPGSGHQPAQMVEDGDVKDVNPVAVFAEGAQKRIVQPRYFIRGGACKCQTSARQRKERGANELHRQALPFKPAGCEARGEESSTEQQREKVVIP